MKTTFTSKAADVAVKLASVLLMSVLAIVVVPAPAYAYIDPGSGTIIVTTVLGLIAAVGFTFRKFFYRLKRRITGRNSQSD